MKTFSKISKILTILIILTEIGLSIFLAFSLYSLSTSLAKSLSPKGATPLKIKKDKNNVFLSILAQNYGFFPSSFKVTLSPKENEQIKREEKVKVPSWGKKELEIEMPAPQKLDFNLTIEIRTLKDLVGIKIKLPMKGENVRQS